MGKNTKVSIATAEGNVFKFEKRINYPLWMPDQDDTVSFRRHFICNPSSNGNFAFQIQFLFTIMMQLSVREWLGNRIKPTQILNLLNKEYGTHFSQRQIFYIIDKFKQGIYGKRGLDAIRLKEEVSKEKDSLCRYSTSATAEDSKSLERLFYSSGK
jgi:hypothetical protein